MEAKTSFTKGKPSISESLHTVVQHPEEDDEELEEKKKKISSQLH